MDVQCPQCGTVFEFDERQMRGPSAMLKCSVCQSMFRLETLLTSGGENQARWMVRNALGDVLYFPSFDKLYRLIMERKVSPDDEVSRTGQKWTRLSDINEFMPVFQVVESILSSLTQGKQAAISRPPSEAPALLTSPDPRPRSPTIQQYASSPPPPRAPTPAPQPPTPLAPAPPKVEPPAPAAPAPPAPQLGALFQPEEPPPRQVTPAPGEFEPALGTVTPVEPWVLGEDVDAVDAPVSRPPGRSRAPLVSLLLLVLLLAGGVGYLLAFEPERAQAWIDSVRASTPAKTPTTPDPISPSHPPVVDAAPSLDAALQGVALAVSAATNGLQNAQLSQTVELGRVGVGASIASASKAAARKASRSDVGTVLKRASRALSRGDKFKARGLYHDALDLDPRNVKAMTGLGWTLISMGKADSASAQFKRAIHFNADFEDAYIGLGKAERQRGRAKAALGAYERYLKRFPRGRKRSIAEHQRTSLRESLGM